MDRLWNLLASVVSPWPLIYLGQNADPPSKPFVTLNMRRLTGDGVIWGEVDADGLMKVYAPVQLRVDLNFIGPGAEAKARNSLMRMRTPSFGIAAEAVDLAYAGLDSITVLDGTVAAPQTEERTQLEVLLNATDVVSDVSGVIEQVVISADPAVTPIPGSIFGNTPTDSAEWLTACEGAVTAPTP